MNVKEIIKQYGLEDFKKDYKNTSGYSYNLVNIDSLKDMEVSYNQFMESYFESLRNVKKEDINSIIVDSYLSVNAKKEEK